jgi:hypothetical protein
MTKPRPVKPPPRKFETPKDIRFNVYTNDEIASILRKYSDDIMDTVCDPLSTESINKMLMIMERMKFLLGQVKQGKTQ